MTSPEGASYQSWRLIDANLNRIGEGLRFLEEIARQITRAFHHEQPERR